MNLVSRGTLKRQVIRSWRALTHGKDLPDLPEDDDRFIRKVSFLEATTESISQFTVGDIIIRTYGISDDLTTKIFQVFSLVSSMFSLLVAFITVSLKKPILDNYVIDIISFFRDKASSNQ